MSHTTSLRVLAESPSEQWTGAWIGKSYADRRREVVDPSRILRACIGMLVPIYGLFRVHVHPRVSNDLLMCVRSSRRIQLGLTVSWISDVSCNYQLFFKWFVPHQ
jgi:hypothetical protein